MNHVLTNEIEGVNEVPLKEVKHIQSHGHIKISHYISIL